MNDDNRQNIMVSSQSTARDAASIPGRKIRHVYGEVTTKNTVIRNH